MRKLPKLNGGLAGAVVIFVVVVLMVRCVWH